jgi:glyoxylase-like metal-dependent hydrolase (beta-lactamase superfamily II)
MKGMIMHPELRIEAHFDTATATLTYLVVDRMTGEAAIIDPVLDYDPAAARTSTQSADAWLELIEKEALTLRYIMETHAHADHLTAAHYLRGKTGAKIVIGSAITKVQQAFKPLFHAGDVTADGAAFDRLVSEGDTLPLGNHSIGVLHTPGHTPACVSYHIGGAAFVGDTLFQPDYGTARCDFPGGDAATLYRSIRKILALPDDTVIHTGHDYPPEGRAPAWTSTVAEQKAGNIHVHDGIDEAAFVAMRNARDATLRPPRLILPSLQVNIRAGDMPPPDSDGRIYLRLPVNQIG